MGGWRRKVISWNGPGAVHCAWLNERPQRDFADGMKLRDLRREDGPGLPRWTQCNLEGPYKGKREMVGSESGDAVMGAEVMAMPLEDRDKGHAQGVLWPVETVQGKEADSSLEPPEGAGPAHTVILAQ